MLPEQHPLEQFDELQDEPLWHTPPTQVWGEAQGGFEPQAHAPAAEQLSAVAPEHPTQLTPLIPQVEKLDVSQTVPEQQPEGQEVPLQTQV